LVIIACRKNFTKRDIIISLLADIQASHSKTINCARDANPTVPGDMSMQLLSIRSRLIVAMMHWAPWYVLKLCREFEAGAPFFVDHLTRPF